MNFQQLSYVIAVHEQRHFARAAEQCHVTQATLSAMLKKLEEELGLTIFDRTRSPVQTTDQGLKVIEIARDILARQEQLLGLKDRSLAWQTGELQIGVIPTVAHMLLPCILKPLRTKYPHMSLVIRELTTEEIIRQLESGELDLGVLATPIAGLDLHTYPLYKEALLIYGELSSDRKVILKEELKGEKIWLLEEGHCFQGQAMTVCDLQAEDTMKESLRFQGNNFDTLLNLVDEFGGYTLIPELYARTLSKSRKAKVKCFEAPEPLRQISTMVYRPFAKQRLVLAFNELVIKQMKKQAIGKQGEVLGVGY